MTTKYTKKGHKLCQMAVKYSKWSYNNIFNSKALQILPKFEFLVWKQTIWQPCSLWQRKKTIKRWQKSAKGLPAKIRPNLSERGLQLKHLGMSLQTGWPDLENFSPVGWLFPFGQFFENYRRSLNIVLLLSTVKIMC
jgi:hypothetical protein